ncbi:TIGR03620 family F420-dependent LLM class oxidoreductase [Nonomuraea rhodomycinica]|uniref:TIGR03620 family F420-dependent LLM class oxidoreductase n=1 Tax=Nonomuraea rhodomycinica TaxID=1712872 RepID=A0A7Y6IR11_9ACTN|nr:TIGR03620 family F420-dependent LLM class oxidoreductase [Nonomuraea rhodomycinica]NUW42645.1 TIGR03620 family F420-dependent LLM class oxidoreductase [Nonomuraea rhodomycinica]
MDTGHVGVWHPLINKAPAGDARAAAAEIERLGYGSVWLNEAPGSKEPLANAGVLLAATTRLAVGTGIASLWARDATAMAAGAATLGDAFPGRFLLGVGVSHSTVAGRRGHDYSKPLTTMRAYLDGMDEAARDLPQAGAPRVLAALRPRMLELARDRADGAHSYFVPPEHTAAARGILGPDRLLIPEQAVVLETDPVRAREIARAHMAYYLNLPNYTNNLRELGYTDEDLAGGGSDRLADAIVAWGDAAAIAARVRAHLDAGADHVAIQPIASGAPDLADALTQLRLLAPALGIQPAVSAQPEGGALTVARV